MPPVADRPKQHGGVSRATRAFAVAITAAAAKVALIVQDLKVRCLEQMSIVCVDEAMKMRSATLLLVFDEPVIVYFKWYDNGSFDLGTVHAFQVRKTRYRTTWVSVYSTINQYDEES